jgi:hypothetical protein
MISMEASELGIAQNLDGTLRIVYRNVSIKVNVRLGRGLAARALAGWLAGWLAGLSRLVAYLASGASMSRMASKIEKWPWPG